jgi:hypothetical protein
LQIVGKPPAAISDRDLRPTSLPALRAASCELRKSWQQARHARQPCEFDSFVSQSGDAVRASEAHQGQPPHDIKRHYSHAVMIVPAQRGKAAAT